MHGKPILARHFLGPQMLLDRHRIVAAALHRGVVAHDDAFAAPHPADAGEDAGGMDRLAIHAVRRHGRQLEKRRARIDELRDALPRQQLAAAHMALARLRRSALGRLRPPPAQVRHQLPHRRGIGPRLFGAGDEAAVENGHV
jgi:hypothetical protein